MSEPVEIVRLDRVCKWVGNGPERTTILHDVSFSIRAGEFLAVMGPSGSGKSTLLSIVGLIESVSAGAVYWFGQDVTGLGDEALAKIRARDIGFIFQAFHLLPHLTSRQNVALPLGYAGREASSPRVDDLLARVRMTHRAAAYPASLSGGEKQRVALARALVNQPALILADEPTGSVDSKTGQQMLELLEDLHRGGTALLLITHDPKVAQRAQRVLTLMDGRLQ